MNRFFVMLLPLALTACADMASQDAANKAAQKPIENKVGPNGELISPDCPNWSGPNTNFNNTRHSNFGCATTTNLGLMLENPRDLVQGASAGRVSPDTERNIKVIRTYRSGGAVGDSGADSTTPLSTTTTTTGQ